MANESSPILLYWERLPPYEIVAAASLAKVKIEPRSDPKATKDYIVTLKVADGCALSVTWRNLLLSSSLASSA